MSSSVAAIEVHAAGPLVTVQDGGRTGVMRFGVPASGPMDRLSHAVANVAVGNDQAASAIEISRGGVTVDCIGGDVTMAIAGGDFEATRGGRPEGSWQVFTCRVGDRVTIRARTWGSWAYLAVAGDLIAPSWLGHTATHAMSGFGGGAVTAGRRFEIANARSEQHRDGEIPIADLARPTGRARVVIGPQAHHFVDSAVDTFVGASYVLTDAFDRMGVRLEGPPLALRDALSLASEPILRGSVQVAGDGVPTVLLADHQTTGGYPKIATLVSADIDRFAQLRIGDTSHFEPVDPVTAIEIARRHAREVDEFLARTAGPGRTMSHRLRESNLISGAVTTNQVSND